MQLQNPFQISLRPCMPGQPAGFFLLQQRGPPRLCDKVPCTAAQGCPYFLRHSSPLAIPLCHTSHRQNSFLPASPALFNSLPVSVTSCSSKPAFQLALDSISQLITLIPVFHGVDSLLHIVSFFFKSYPIVNSLPVEFCVHACVLVLSFIVVGFPRGILHAGCGASTVRLFLATLNIPHPVVKTLERRKQESGSFVEVAAKRACTESI